MIQTTRLNKNSEFRKQPAMARLLRAWEVLTADQKEDKVYLAKHGESQSHGILGMHSSAQYCQGD
jgi:hypothetical protein